MCIAPVISLALIFAVLLFPTFARLVGAVILAALLSLIAARIVYAAELPLVATASAVGITNTASKADRAGDNMPSWFMNHRRRDVAFPIVGPHASGFGLPSHRLGSTGRAADRSGPLSRKARARSDIMVQTADPLGPRQRTRPARRATIALTAEASGPRPGRRARRSRRKSKRREQRSGAKRRPRHALNVMEHNVRKQAARAADRLLYIRA
jgi:hypothetical protein